VYAARNFTEITSALFERRHKTRERTFIDSLVVVFVTEKEKQLVAVLVEVRARNDDRAADIEAGIIVLAQRPLDDRIGNGV
jgi:hypothetical protein